MTRLVKRIVGPVLVALWWVATLTPAVNAQDQGSGSQNAQPKGGGAPAESKVKDARAKIAKAQALLRESKSKQNVEAAQALLAEARILLQAAIADHQKAIDGLVSLLALLDQNDAGINSLVRFVADRLIAASQAAIASLQGFLANTLTNVENLVADLLEEIDDAASSLEKRAQDLRDEKAKK